MEIIDQVRQAADIVDIASQYTTLRRRGRKHVGLCPFHSEKAPSFTVDSEKQLFHCFGCGVGGDVFTLVMEKENLTFPEALTHLAERYHVPLPQKTRLSPELQKLEEKVYRINETALAFFRRNLFQKGEGESALGYLRKRGLSDGTIEELKVGYAPNSWNALVTHFQGGGTQPALLEKAGLVLPGQKRPEYYDRFRARVIFPIFSLSGKVVAFGGRTVADADPKYLNSPDTPVYSKGKVLYGLNWTKEAVREAGELILVEGYTDFASLYQAGIRNVAASLGTALTPHQVDIARRATGHDSAKIIINYDGDAAGKNAAFRAVPLCFEKGVQTQVLVLPQGLDPDGFIRKHGPKTYSTWPGDVLASPGHEPPDGEDERSRRKVTDHQGRRRRAGKDPGLDRPERIPAAGGRVSGGGRVVPAPDDRTASGGPGQGGRGPIPARRKEASSDPPRRRETRSRAIGGDTGRRLPRVAQ
jgi:DNA primase